MWTCRSLLCTSPRTASSSRASPEGRCAVSSVLNRRCKTCSDHAAPHRVAAASLSLSCRFGVDLGPLWNRSYRVDLSPRLTPNLVSTDNFVSPRVAAVRGKSCRPRALTHITWHATSPTARPVPCPPAMTARPPLQPSAQSATQCGLHARGGQVLLDFVLRARARAHRHEPDTQPTVARSATWGVCDVGGDEDCRTKGDQFCPHMLVLDALRNMGRPMHPSDCGVPV